MDFRSALSIAVFSLLLAGCQKEVENPVEKLEEKDIHFLSLHLYPSTIRMVNIANDSNFYKATKNVESAHYLQVNLDSPEKKEVYEDWEKQRDFSEWEELMSARMNGSMISIYTPSNKEPYYFASIKSEAMASLVWLKGEVDLNQVTQLMKSGINLGPVTDFLIDKQDEQKRSEKMKSIRKQMQEVEEENVQQNEDSSGTS